MGSFPIGDCKVFRGVSDEMGFGVGGEMMLDGERGELVRASARTGKRALGGVSDVRAAMALKSHSEAERRRRERINSHLATLRSLIPTTTTKLDKAALLAEVISHMKHLKSAAVEISRRCNIPSDTDEVRVESTEDGTNEGRFLVKASLCCEDRPELPTELKQVIQSLHLKIMNSEISTLGGRAKHVFEMTPEACNNGEEKHLLISSVQQAFKSLLERISSQTKFSQRSSFSGKRRNILPFESSCSSS